MQTFAVFLRGVNVGGRTIKMEDLKACLERAGYLNVKTFLASGNVVLESDKDISQVRSDIEKTLTDRFNYPAIVFVYTMTELRAIIADFPFEDRVDCHNYIVFTDSDLAAALALADDVIEQVKLGMECVYWQVPKGQTLKSPFAEVINKKPYKEHVTVRNLNTLRKMTS